MQQCTKGGANVLNKCNVPLFLSKYCVLLCLIARAIIVLGCIFSNSAKFINLFNIAFIGVFAVELFSNGLYFLRATNEAIEKRLSSIHDVKGVWSRTGLPPLYGFFNMLLLFLFYSNLGLSFIIQFLAILITDFCIFMLHLKSEEALRCENANSQNTEDNIL
jgi:hypothetical protein